MNSSTLLFAIDDNIIESESELKPRMIAFYEKNYNVVEPANKMFYFKKPIPQNYPINLNEGHTRVIKRDPSSLDLKECLNFCLKHVMSSEPKKSVENISKIKIFTQRGALVDLIECYHKKKPDILVHVTRYNGNLYMVRQKDYVTNKPNTEDEIKYTHDGQFRRNLFTESFHCEPNPNEAWNANKGLFGVYQCTFEDFEIVYSGPIYGIETEDEFKDFDNLEALNSCRYVIAKQMWCDLREDHIRHLHYWLEAYLSNATDLYFGYKDKEGFVREPLVHKSLSELKEKYNSHWKQSICIGFLHKFLQEVNNLMTTDNVNSLTTVYNFKVDLTTRTIEYEKLENKPEMILVTPDYMEYCQMNC